MVVSDKIVTTTLLVGLLTLAGLVEPLQAAKNREQLNAEAIGRMKKDLFFLASPDCEGRGPTTKGLSKAADYIADQFRQMGLQPGAGTGYFQPFTIAGATGKLTLTGPQKQTIELTQGVHFNPLGMDQLGAADAPLVFAGYGLTCTTPAYNDYADLDVKGKIVVVLRDSPRATDPTRTREMRTGAALLTKVQLAQRRGAAGVILVNDADTIKGDIDAPLDYSYTRLVRGGKPRSIPTVALQRGILEQLLPAGQTLENIEKQIDRDLKPASVSLAGWSAKLSVQSRRDMIPLKNVVGVLPGHGPLADETIVVGAHYDHLGYGSSSSMAQSKKRAIHFGADDNASGTTAMLELARRFAAMPNREGRRLVFIAFSGEELGLFGSKHYCEKPLFPLAKTAGMFNLDMVGRMRKDQKTGMGRILTEGHGTAKPFKEMIDNLAKKHQFTLSSKPSGFGPSDHDSFCAKKVPVLFFWTGNHDEYHKPTDTPERIDLQSMRRIVDAGEELVTTFTTMSKPSFIEVKGGTPVRPSTGPRLGFRPGYDEDVEGIKVEQPTPGGPAEKAGVKAGDVIVKIGAIDVKDFPTYAKALAVQKVGGTTDLVVLRKGKRVTLKVKFE